MTTHKTGTREQWLAARLELLEAEKELTRRSDELARQRQELPWVRVDKEYRFETDEAAPRWRISSAAARSSRLSLHVRPRLHGGLPVLLDDRGRLQRLRRPSGEPRCHAMAVSRAPLAKLQAYKRRMGWTFPWASSSGGDFNFDFNVSFTEEQQREGGIEYNYRREKVFQSGPERTPGLLQAIGEGGQPEGRESRSHVRDRRATYMRERPGVSAFALEDGVVYHTYSTYARGLDGLWGMYQWLDRAPKGRNETGLWWKRHDEYAK